VTFPTPFTVGVHTWSAGADSAYNEPADVYTPAKTSAGTEYKVCGWSAPTSTEPKLAGHDRVVVDVELLAPTSVPIHAHDLVDLPDGQYEVIGEPEDYNHGPFNFVPDVLVANLRKVSG